MEGLFIYLDALKRDRIKRIINDHKTSFGISDILIGRSKRYPEMQACFLFEVENSFSLCRKLEREGCVINILV